jgi:hypothetical protein
VEYVVTDGGNDMKLDPKTIMREGACWIHLSFDRNHWQAVVKMVE